MKHLERGIRFFDEQIDDTFECEKRKMEADISSQAVGLASSADFSLINLFITSRYYCKISNYIIDSVFNLFMGNYYRKI